MTTFICKICFKSFNRKYNYERHLSRKIKCLQTPVPAKTKINKSKRLICKYCKKSFTNNSSMSRHIKQYCKQITICDDKNQMYQMIIELHQKMNQKNKKLNLLENKFKHITMNNNNCNYNNCNNVVTNNIVVNNFGNENMSFLRNRDRQHKLFITNILKEGFSGLQKYIQYKYCNPKHEENLTVKYTNKRHKDILIRKNNKWITANTDYVLDEIYNWDKNVEEVLTIYEKVFDLENVPKMDSIQENFVKNLETIYCDEIVNTLEKAKQNTLHELYDCYANNKSLYKPE